jgi:hypothetical protein
MSVDLSLELSRWPREAYCAATIPSLATRSAFEHISASKTASHCKQALSTRSWISWIQFINLVIFSYLHALDHANSNHVQRLYKDVTHLTAARIARSLSRYVVSQTKCSRLWEKNPAL